jgi:FMN phosphatase YigB (HAD superfamily)
MINFKIWIENKEEDLIIFLDLDETLVSTHKIPLLNNPEEIKALGGVLINNSYASFLRPHAIDFVNNLKAVAKVCIITAGGSLFQKKVIKALGIPIDENDIFNLLYPPFAVRTQIQKRSQIILLKEVGRMMRSNFNDSFAKL